VIEGSVTATRQQARVAGWLYLLLALIGPIGLLYVPGQLIVPDNARATADNLRASGELLRLGIVSDLAHQIVAVFLVLARALRLSEVTTGVDTLVRRFPGARHS